MVTFRKEDGKWKTEGNIKKLPNIICVLFLDKNKLIFIKVGCNFLSI